MHQGGAREEGRRRGARGEVSAKLSNGGGTGYCSASESSSSESMSGGSGSSKNVGRPLGVYFSPVNVKAPESLMNSERAAMPLDFGGSQELWEGEFAVLCSELRPPRASYRSHVLMMCCVSAGFHRIRSRRSSRGKTVSGILPWHAWPVRHCTTGRLKTSR